MVKCSACGGELPATSRFCPACGQAIVKDAASAPTLTMPKAAPDSPGRLSTSPDDRKLTPGAVLGGRYRIISLLGKGGMGEVYRADDLTLGQQVALKFLPRTLASNSHALARLRSEVRLARQVSHPNVCRVYDIGESEGDIFLSMEYVDGEDLASLLRRIGRVPSDKAIEVARKLCAGLAAAHHKGVLHRDLKPGNVMLDSRGEVLLADFGLAAVADQVEGAEVRSGTPVYMAPEQMAGEEVTVRSDIYSLGLLLYEIFTGKRPFESDTLAGLARARTDTSPASLTSLVRDLDPAVERIILRCLEPKPSNRPASALAVAAALPGGDPLAAALAAGETPSPELVAAAGEGAGLELRYAIPVAAVLLASLVAFVVFANRLSALEQIRPEYSPEVLSQKARDIIERAGYAGRPADSDHSFFWDYTFINHVNSNDKPYPRWTDILAKRSSALNFWYRQSNHPMIGLEIHDDLLTPGIVTQGDPPLALTGMVNVVLDERGRLREFQAIPPQRQDPARQATPVDWSPLFGAAGLDPARLQPAEPIWNWLVSSDTRLAWTGTWPENNRPLRVEAAAERGKPVVFYIMGPWYQTDRMPSEQSASGDRMALVLLLVLAIGVLLGGAAIARRNIRLGRGDRRGAFMLGCWIFGVQMALWLCRMHFSASIGTFGMFILALSHALFYASFLWVIYIAVEPFVRRYWPQTLISWTALLSGRPNDPIVGRDILIGIAVGSVWAVTIMVIERFMDVTSGGLRFISTEALAGFKSATGEWLEEVIRSIRTAWVYFFVIFVARVLLRNQWVAGAVVVGIFTMIGVLGSKNIVTSLIFGAVIFSTAFACVLRFGVLTLTIAFFTFSLLFDIPVTMNTSAWYFGNATFMLATVAALAAWSFRSATRQAWSRPGKQPGKSIRLMRWQLSPGPPKPTARPRAFGSARCTNVVTERELARFSCGEPHAFQPAAAGRSFSDSAGRSSRRISSRHGRQT